MSPTCPICQNGMTPILRRSDNYSCGVRFGVPSPDLPRGEVTYAECGHCGHVSTAYFDDWTDGTFRDRIYNETYHLYDPGYVLRRPTALAAAVVNHYRPGIRVLDYGSGSGIVPRLLRDAGFDAHGYDPMTDDREPAAGSFDLVLCTEVLEHVPDPWQPAAIISRLAREGADVVLTTLLLPEAREHDFWWLGPRNGHIHAFSARSLDLLFPGMTSYSPGVHSLGAPPRAFLKEVQSAILCERETADAL
ncbi:MAG: class I SAM-dependent methyltransferase [Rhodobacteraceae bacterium]|nr:class I SAM-dependent methyltransferase [Paracoccaceae bacterium]